jgi:uncharacterized circularly permuted ATP-grasp superfamily protein/uncharacterized alpha-E superfamily protein
MPNCQPPVTIPAPTPPRGPYVPAPGVFDEMMLPDGTVRPHWTTFASFLEQCSTDDLRSRADAVQRLLYDHGVTYNVFEDALGTSRPWALDLLPFLVSSAEFQTVTTGLAQRARLLEAILQDLYGPQHLIRKNLLPAQLVYANPGFLRPVCGVNPPGGRFLYIYGCDLVRGRDGRWMVLADRTQSPSAHGYTLENRTILGQVFQEEFHTSHVRRLTDYFDLMRDAMRTLSPQGRRGAAGIVMLTPGPKHETYFEHAYKARHLGFPLAEGADLTVRDRRLWLKTLEGLKRVDVVLRHIDDIESDPLELKSNTDLGIPGLTEAWRSGSVALANGLGTSLVETPALNPFLPGICRHLLGEELRMACIPTWWCGQPAELKLVLSNPARWVLKPAFARGARDPIFLAHLSRADQTVILDRLRAAPQDWVAQEMLPLSTTPTFTQGQIQPRALVWRTLGVATARDPFTFMPGGLTRVSPEPDRWVVTMRSGGISKDTWVVSPDPVEALPPLPTASAVIRPARPPSGVPSRAADHLFWLGRYAERLEQTVRLLRTAIHRLTGERSDLQSREAEACLALITSISLIPATATRLIDHLPDLMRDGRQPGSLPDLLSRIRFNAAAARDRLSDDIWRLLHRIERDARLPAGAFVLSTAQSTLDTLVLDLAAFGGMHLENVTRGHGWRFLEIGRRLERAASVLELPKAATPMARHGDAVLPPILEIFDSTMTYRRFHFARPALAPVLDLLLLEESNPRSAAFQLRELAHLIRHLPIDKTSTNHGAERAIMDDLQSHLVAFPLTKLATQPALLVENLNLLGDTLIDGIQSLSDTITERFFSHATRRVH